MEGGRGVQRVYYWKNKLTVNTYTHTLITSQWPVAHDWPLSLSYQPNGQEHTQKNSSSWCTWHTILEQTRRAGAVFQENNVMCVYFMLFSQSTVVQSMLKFNHSQSWYLFGSLNHLCTKGNSTPPRSILCIPTYVTPTVAWWLMYAAPLMFVCLILCLCFSFHILHFNRVHNPTNGLSWILTCHQKGIQQQQSIYSIGELWLHSWVCGKQRDTSRMAFAVCVFGEECVVGENVML